MSGLTKGNITFGRVYKDDATGYIGTATGVIEYMGGDVQVRLEAVKQDGSGTLTDAWVQVSRLSFVDGGGTQA